MGPNNTNIDPKRTPTWSPNAYLDKSRLGALGRPFKDQGTRAPGNRRDPSGHTNFRAEAPGGNTEGVLLLRKCNICITVHWCTKFNPLHALTLKGCCLVGECFLKCVGQGEKQENQKLADHNISQQLHRSNHKYVNITITYYSPTHPGP